MFAKAYALKTSCQTTLDSHASLNLTKTLESSIKLLDRRQKVDGCASLRPAHGSVNSRRLPVILDCAPSFAPIHDGFHHDRASITANRNSSQFVSQQCVRWRRNTISRTLPIFRPWRKARQPFASSRKSFGDESGAAGVSNSEVACKKIQQSMATTAA